MAEHSPNPLARLILDRCATLNLSLSEASRRAGLSRNTVQAMVSRELRRPPAVESLQSLARVLEVPLQDLSDAAQRSTGYRVVDIDMDDPNIQLLVSTAQELDDEGREQLAEIATTLLRSARRRQAAGS